MSDLHQAVQAEMASHTPVSSPPFDVLRARKRSRDRRVKVAAVAGSALAVVSITFAASALGGGRRHAEVAGDVGAAEVFVVGVKPTDAKSGSTAGRDAQEIVGRCLQSHGVSHVVALLSDPGQW